MMINLISFTPMSLFLSGNSLVVIDMAAFPARIKFLLGLISNTEYFRFIYNIYDMTILLVIKLLIGCYNLIIILLNFIFVFLGVLSCSGCTSIVGTSAKIGHLTYFSRTVISEVYLDYVINLIVLMIECGLIVLIILFLLKQMNVWIKKITF
jgi:hypothetical protein